jgi:hypothetical protein
MIVKKYISIDFPNAIIIVKQFQKNLADNDAIYFESMTLRGDELTIVLGDLADPEQSLAIIDSIIANFVPDQSYNIDNFQQITIYPTPDNKTFLQQWQQLTFFTFKGTLKTGIPDSVSIFANVSADNPQGEIRLYDSTNRVEICKFIITAKMPTEYVLFPHDCIWPRQQAIIEIHARQSTANFLNYTICSVVTIK